MANRKTVADVKALIEQIRGKYGDIPAYGYGWHTYDDLHLVQENGTCKLVFREKGSGAVRDLDGGARGTRECWMVLEGLRQGLRAVVA